MHFSRSSRAFCVFLSTLMVVSTFPLSALRADDMEIKYYSVMEGNEFEVEQITTSTWDGHANIELKIKNTGDEIIDNWHITFKTPYVIENIWNATIVETDNCGTYTIRNNYYNQDIGTDSEVTIGMTLALGDNELGSFSGWYLLNTRTYEVESDRYFISYQEYSKWDGGFNGALMLSSKDNIEDWSLSFSSEYEISTISNAAIEYVDSGVYTIVNDGFSQNLSSNMLLLSIQGIPTENDFAIDNVLMYSIGMAYSLSDDEDNNGIADYLDYIYSFENTVPLTPIPTDNPTTPTPVNHLSESSVVWVDSDGDGLSDEDEVLYGTNIEEEDSDFDGIIDSIELSIGYLPNNPDSDDNGIPDGQEDFDKDGITNSLETINGTCLYLTDSDFDDIDDYDEIYVYGTDPNREDSNDDGILDGDALKLGFNPQSLDSDQNGIPDKDEKTYQEINLQISEDAERQGVSSVEIKGNFTNLIASTTTIEDVYGKDVYSSEIEAIVGGLVSIETTSGFDKATIVFHYDEEEIGVEEDDLCILWYDEANCEYVMLDEYQSLDTENNTVSLVTTHFSEYMLISKTKWLDTWEKSITKVYEDRVDLEKEKCGTVKYMIALKLSLDDSEEFYRNHVLNAYMNIVSHFRNENDIAGLLLYSGDAYRVTGGVNSQYNGVVISNIYDMYVAGNPNIGNMFKEANYLRQGYTSETDEVILYVLTDERDINLDDYSDIILEGNYHVVLVSIDNSSAKCSSSWGTVLDSTNNKNIYIASLQAEMDLLRNNYSNIVNADKDEDGLTNIEELSGIILSNGTIVYTDYDNPDSDDDEIDDRSELGIKRTISSLNVYERLVFERKLPEFSNEVSFWSYYSNPTDPDTDHDDFFDILDARPKIKNPDKIYILGLKSSVPYSQDDDSLESDTDPEAQARLLKWTYQNLGYTVDAFFFSSSDEFINEWSHIGCSVKESLLGEYTGKYYYNVTNVVIVTHGTCNSIKTGSDDNLISAAVKGMDEYKNISLLEHRKIKSLNLYTCEGGKKDENNISLAENFLTTIPTIEQVVAFDTKLRKTNPTYNTYSYFGRWINEKKNVSVEEYKYYNELLAKQNADGVEEGEKKLIYLNVDESSVQGFKCFVREGDSITGRGIFEGDIRYGTLYWYGDLETSPNADKTGIAEYDDSKYNTDNRYDPLIIGY